MTNFTSAHAVSPRVLIDFFEKTLPFSELDRNVLNQLALGGLVDFYRKGQIILQQDASGVGASSHGQESPHKMGLFLTRVPRRMPA